MDKSTSHDSQFPFAGEDSDGQMKGGEGVENERPVVSSSTSYLGQNRSGMSDLIFSYVFNLSRYLRQKSHNSFIEIYS